MRKILGAAIVAGTAILAMPALAEDVVNVLASVEYVDPDTGTVVVTKEYLSARQYPSISSCLDQLNNEGRAEMLSWARKNAPKLSSGKEAQIVIDLLACDKR